MHTNRLRFYVDFRDCGSLSLLLRFPPLMKNPALLFSLAAAAIGFTAFSIAQDKAEPAQSEAVPNDQFVSLFDGETLNGWEGDDRFWRVEGGVIPGNRPRRTRSNTTPSSNGPTANSTTLS